MIFSQKKYFLFFIFLFFIFILFFPRLSLLACSPSTVGQQQPVQCIISDCGENKHEDCGHRTCRCKSCTQYCPDEETGEMVPCGSYPCQPCCWQYTCSGSFEQYKATGDDNDCEATIDIRRCRSFCSNQDPDQQCTCSGCYIECGIQKEDGWTPNESETCKQCESWQKAVDNSCENPESDEWCKVYPPCKCCGECIDEVEGPPSYYQDPFSSISADPNNVYLPVKLEWNDVRGFWGGGDSGAGPNQDAYYACTRNVRSECWTEIRLAWQEENPGRSFCCGWHTGEHADCLRSKCEHLWEELEDCSRCPLLEEEEKECYDKDEFVNYYQIEIWGTQDGGLIDCGTSENVDKYTAFLEASEFFAPCLCFFKSGWTYNWRVRGCCDDNEDTCRPWSEIWNFTTNLAPEPLWPYDPDWNDEDGARNVSYEDSRELRWCGTDNPNYYNLIEWEGETYHLPLSYEVILYVWDKDENKYICLDAENGRCVPQLVEPRRGIGEKLPPTTLYTSIFITKDKPYAWQVRACREYDGGECGDDNNYSQFWKFDTAEDWDMSVGLVSPPDNPDKLIGIPVKLIWSSPYAHSFKYRIHKTDSGELIESDDISFSDLTLYHREQSEDLNILDLNTKYQWFIMACSDTEAEECEDDWMGPWNFITTGRPPEEFKTNEGVFIPVEFSWEKVPGAKSYRLWVEDVGLTEDIIVGERAEFSMDFMEHNIRPGGNYSWKVKTCALPAGEICGEYSDTQNFSTFNWEPPSDLQPEAGENIDPKKPIISWKGVGGARIYEYKIEIISVNDDDPKDECKDTIDPITGKTSAISVNLREKLKCWGQYRWSITPCLDAGCTIHGPTVTETFEFMAEVLGEGESPGLVPCGQKAVNLNRPWLDETEPCGIKHLFIVLYIIVNFVLTTIAPLILVLLVLASGVIFYFSIKMEAPNPVAKVKSLWKAAGIGIALLLFAWTITSLLLTVFGYRLGPWYIIG